MLVTNYGEIRSLARRHGVKCGHSTCRGCCMASLGTPPGLIRFGPFALDPINRELRKRGYLVRLQPQQLAVLLLLTYRAGQLVSREEIHQHIWGNDTFVDF